MVSNVIAEHGDICANKASTFQINLAILNPVKENAKS